MEEGLRQTLVEGTVKKFSRLNPCCNGRGSKTQFRLSMLLRTLSLNPCCNGRGSKTHRISVADVQESNVLILVVMEEGLRLSLVVVLLVLFVSLNPCRHGRGSKTT